MSVDLQDIPAVQSKYVCGNSSAMSTLIEGSEVVVWRDIGQMKPEVQESRLPCLVGPWEGRGNGSECAPRQSSVSAIPHEEGTVG